MPTHVSGSDGAGSWSFEPCWDGLRWLCDARTCGTVGATSSSDDTTTSASAGQRYFHAQSVAPRPWIRRLANPDATQSVTTFPVFFFVFRDPVQGRNKNKTLDTNKGENKKCFSGSVLCFVRWWEGPNGRGPKGKGPEGWVARKVGGGERGRHFSLFSFSRHNFHSLFPLLGLLVEVWPRFKAMDHPNCALGILWGHFVRARAACSLWVKILLFQFG